MAITLEQIKGMDILVGTPIELIINSSISSETLEPNPDNKTFKELGYFKRLNDDYEQFPKIEYINPTGSVSGAEIKPKSQMLCVLEKVNILNY